MTETIQITSCRKSFEHAGERIHVINDLNLNLPSRRKVAIVGPSGSGKSTLLSLLSGLAKPDSGSITIEGKTITAYGEEDMALWRRTSLGVVFQQFHLVQHLSAVENVALPLQLLGDKDHKDKAIEALKKVGLAHRLNHRPGMLSGGENQRVAIARAVIHKPSLILADEPSGNLDEKTGSQVMDHLFEQAENVHLLLVTHDMALAKQCDATFLLHEGQLHEQAS